MSDTHEQQSPVAIRSTPLALAREICSHLRALGARPDVIIDPVCGGGNLLRAAIDEYPAAGIIIGGDIDPLLTGEARAQLRMVDASTRVQIRTHDLFDADWRESVRHADGAVLVLANPPWIDPRDPASRAVGGSSDFRPRGLAALAGSTNTELPDVMTLEMKSWFAERAGELAVLLKTTAARRLLSRAEALQLPVRTTSCAPIDARAHFGVTADLCLMHVVFDYDAPARYRCDWYSGLNGTVIGQGSQRDGVSIADAVAYDRFAYLRGASPVRWRSGLKHDAAPVMELTRTGECLRNGLGECVDIEAAHVYPLMKGSDVANGRDISRSVIVTQHTLGESTEHIEQSAPKTWTYLQSHASRLDGRRSRIYVGRPPFCIFGVGEYAFRPWKIAVCGLYPTPRFTLIPPDQGRPVMLDDTTYYVSFAAEWEARDAYAAITSMPYVTFLRAQMFGDKKRPVTAKLLNAIDWSRVGQEGC
jgi:hypothetical protein